MNFRRARILRREALSLEPDPARRRHVYRALKREWTQLPMPWKQRLALSLP